MGRIGFDIAGNDSRNKRRGDFLVFLFLDNIAAGEGEEYSGGQESG